MARREETFCDLILGSKNEPCMHVAVAKCIHCKKDVCMPHTSTVFDVLVRSIEMNNGVPANVPQEIGKTRVAVHVCLRCKSRASLIVSAFATYMSVIAPAEEIHRMYDAAEAAHHLTR